MDRSASPKPASHTSRRFLGQAALALAGAVALPALTGERSVLAASLSVTACNTVSGAGQDVKAAGQAVTNTAEDAKK